MSRFSIGVLLESFRLPVGEALTQARKVGAQGVQIYVTRGEVTPETMTADKMKELKKYARRKWACGFCTVRRPR